LTQKKRLEKVKESNSVDAPPSNAPTTTTTPNKMFSVEPLFPEHKRKSEETTTTTATESSDNDFVNLKKPRVKGRAVAEKESLYNLPGWAKVVVPVAAIIAMLALTSLRKK
jgi:hypothetical protein